MPSQNANYLDRYSKLGLKVKAVETILNHVTLTQAEMAKSKVLHGSNVNISKVGRDAAIRTDAVPLARQMKTMNQVLRAATESNARKGDALLDRTFPKVAKDDVPTALHYALAFDRYSRMNPADLNLEIMRDPSALPVLLNSPFKIPGLDLSRSIQDRIEATFPNEVAELAAEREALAIGAAALNNARSEMQAHVGMLNNEFDTWLEKSVPAPSGQELAAASREVATNSVAQVIEQASALPYEDRVALIDKLLSKGGDDLAQRERDLKAA
jgi:hypothetical protein